MNGVLAGLVRPVWLCLAGGVLLLAGMAFCLFGRSDDTGASVHRQKPPPPIAQGECQEHCPPDEMILEECSVPGVEVPPCQMSHRGNTLYIKLSRQTITLTLDEPDSEAIIGGYAEILRSSGFPGLIKHWYTQQTVPFMAGQETALHEMVHGGGVEGVKFLIDQNVDVNGRDSDGATPLHIAALVGHQKIAQLLLCSGADIGAVDNENKTPLDYAIHERNKKMIFFLVQHGAPWTLEASP